MVIQKVYKFSWQYLKYHVFNSLIYELEKQELSVEQKRGIISFIPKKDKNRQLLTN